MEVAILVGLPAAGKTSFYRERLAATHVHVSKDVIGHGRETARREREAVAAALRSGRSVAVDDTNPRVSDRAPLIALARAAGATAVAYVLDTPATEAALRNRRRPPPDRVPAVAVHVAAKRLERPTRAEGLDAVYLVRAQAGDYEVSAVE